MVDVQVRDLKDGLIFLRRELEKISKHRKAKFTNCIVELVGDFLSISRQWESQSRMVLVPVNALEAERWSGRLYVKYDHLNTAVKSLSACGTASLRVLGAGHEKPANTGTEPETKGNGSCEFRLKQGGVGVNVEAEAKLVEDGQQYFEWQDKMPEMVEMQEIEDWRTAARLMRYAYSTDNARPNLRYARIRTEVEGEVQMAATDGHRLAVAEWAEWDFPWEEDEICVMGEECGLIDRYLDEELSLGIEVEHDEKPWALWIQMGPDGRYFSRSELGRGASARFPDFQQTMPKSYRGKCTFSVKELYKTSSTMRKVMETIELKGSPGGSTVQVDGAAKKGAVAMKGELKVLDAVDGKLHLGLGPDYVRDIAMSFEKSGEVRFEWVDGLTPTRWTKVGDTDFFVILMPLRI